MNIIRAIRSGLTLISPTLNTKVNYLIHHRKFCNLKNPKTFEEKVLWLKLNKYMKDPTVIQCADKYRVREYITERGCGEILNDLIAVYDSPDEINWDALPNQFVLKWNFGSSYNFVCKDKAKVDRVAVTEQFRKWGKDKYWLPYSELQYKYAPRKLICEKYLEDAEHPDAIPDYKAYCFHGEPLAFLVMHDRGATLKREFFDKDWKRLPNPEGCPAPAVMTPRPECLDKMIEVSRKLCKEFPFVRCDYYIVNNQVIFGEMTFTPAGGVYFKYTTIDGKPMADFLDLQIEK